MKLCASGSQQNRQRCCTNIGAKSVSMDRNDLCEFSFQPDITLSFLTRSVRYLLGYNVVLSVETQQTFRRKMSSPSSGLNSKETQKSARSKQQAKRPALPICFMLSSCSTWSSNPETRGDLFLRNVGCFQRMHGVICQKIEFFITTAKKTSHPTILCLQTQEKCLIIHKEVG
jgi:hypothetical protein